MLIQEYLAGRSHLTGLSWCFLVVYSLTGSIFGATILSALPQFMRSLRDYRYVVYAIMVVLIINFKPNGLLGEWELTPTHIKETFKKIKNKFNRNSKES